MRSRIADNLEWLFTQDDSPSVLTPARLLAFVEAKRETSRDEVRLPSGFSGHDYAVYLLHIAAEIEHVLMVQYLYAAYSLGGPQVPEGRRSDVQRWRDVILDIAKEEMAHLITVENLLRLLGAPLNLDRRDYPWDAPFFPFPFNLEPLSRASLARYVITERPEEWPADVSAEEQREIEHLANAGESETVKRVGVLYDLMIKVIGDHALVPDALFQADTLPYQASWEEWGRGYRGGAKGTADGNGKPPVLLIGTAYSRESAVQALHAVAEQGEAPHIDPGAGERSHFRRFLRLYREFPKEGADWSPVADIPLNPRTMGGKLPIEGTTYIANKHSRHWADLFNLRYRMLLLYLSHAYRVSGMGNRHADSKARGMLVHRTFGEMYNLRAVSQILMQLPLCDPADERRAGPPFEMPYSITLPAVEHDCWLLHMDLLEASAALIRKIEPGATARERDYLASLAGIDRETMSAIAALMGIDAAVALRRAGSAK
jgi:ferritin-like protein